ncbi:MAG: hypothetical protein J0H48_12790 [Nitrosospira multiformis]|nr:hypothetical protein [Nitrosospira multiformis]
MIPAPDSSSGLYQQQASGGHSEARPGYVRRDNREEAVSGVNTPEQAAPQEWDVAGAGWQDVALRSGG